MPGVLRENGLLSRVVPQIRGQGWALSAVFVLELLSTPLSLLSPVGIKIAIDNVIGGKPVPHALRVLVPDSFVGSPKRLLFAAVAIQILVVLLTQAHWLCNYLLKIRSGGHMLLNFRSRLFCHLQLLPLGYHDVNGSADSAFRVQDDAAALRSITIDGALFLLSDVVKLAGMIAVTLFIDWRLGLVALSIVPLLVLYAIIYQHRVGDRYKYVKELESSALHVVHEVLSTMRVVKAFVQEENENKRFVQRSSAAEEARIRLAYADALFGFAVNFTTAFGMAMVLLIGIRNVQSSALTLGSLLLIITYLVQLYAPLQNITYHLASLKASAASVSRALEVFDAEPEVLGAKHVGGGPAAERSMRASGAIKFDDVTFGYASKPPILRNFTLSVPAGSHVGVIGRTGAGKTSFVNLLVRFVSPTSGGIFLDGQNIQSLNLAELRTQFAFVLQEPVLFSTTIAENIAYGQPGASHGRIVAAAKAASIHDFIDKLPHGYQTEVGERGLLLSGGERQRISIARAFLQDAPILILDEPTSALDVGTEIEILQTLQTLIAGRTCFLISHRLDAVADCDFIINLNNGVSLETDGHAALSRLSRQAPTVAPFDDRAESTQERPSDENSPYLTTAGD
jgi:ATP-binding cassette subfamily B protein